MEMLYEKLKVQFPEELQEKDNGSGHPYIPFQPVLDRLNEVLGPENWSVSIVDKVTVGTSAMVTVEITCTYEGKTFSRQAVGTHINKKTSAGEEQKLESVKSAMTDAIKKAAQLLGIPSVVKKPKFTSQAQRNFQQQRPAPQQQNQQRPPQQNQPPQQGGQASPLCADCGYHVGEQKVVDFSNKKFGRTLCFNCQKKNK